MIAKRSGRRIHAGLVTDHWKTSLEDYLRAAHYIFEEVKKRGFSPRFPVPVDPDGELLNGSHRVALAVALDISVIPIVSQPHYVWAPPWDFKWFVQNGMLKNDLDMLKSDLENMNAQANEN